MKKVCQTKFGNKHGNCMAACLASLLEIDIEDVFDVVTDDGPWWSVFCEWLKSKGYSPLEIIWPISSGPEGVHIFPNENQICWAVGKSPRGDFRHCILVKWYLNGWIVCHDPHPDDTGLDGPIEIIGMLVPLDPLNQDYKEKLNGKTRNN